MKGTFNWNHAVLVDHDEEQEYWYDPVNDTRHVVQNLKENAMFNSMTFNMIKDILTDDAYIAFEKWMYGQTCTSNDKGEIVVYSWDFERWVRETMKHGFPVEEQMGPDWN